MNIIQSFWSKPFLEQSEDHNARFKGGWKSTNLFFYSTLLSCLSLKKHYKNVTLYTDDYGADLFHSLQIPYTSIQTDLNSLDGYSGQLWALGKVFTYALQQQPFLHIDMDVFIWNKFPDDFLQSDICFQNIEYNFPRYKEIVDIMISDFNDIPEAIYQEYNETGDIWAFNAGILGGTNTTFFKEFSKTVFNLIDNNLGNLKKINIGLFNMVYEQMLGYNLAYKNKLSTSYLYEKMNASFSDVMKFHLLPKKEFYIHTVGEGKRSSHVTEQLEARLQYEYPQEFKKLQLLLDQEDLYDQNHQEIKGERINYLHSIYNWLDHTDWKTKMETNFMLHPECKFKEEVDDVFIIYRSPQDGNIINKKIEDWDLFLLNFEEKTTINYIINEVSQIESISSQFSNDELQEKLFSFVMDKCIYHQILIPDFLASKL